MHEIALVVVKSRLWRDGEKQPNNRFERDAPPASWLRAPQAKLYVYGVHLGR